MSLAYACMQLFVKCTKRIVTTKVHVNIALPAAPLNHNLQYCCCHPGHLVAEKHKCSIMHSLLSSGVDMATSGYVWTYVYSTVALLNLSCMNNACNDSCKRRHTRVRQCRQTQGQTSRQTDSAHAHSKHHYLRSTYASRQTDRQTVTYPDKFTEGRQAGTQTAT